MTNWWLDQGAILRAHAYMTWFSQKQVSTILRRPLRPPLRGALKTIANINATNPRRPFFGRTKKFLPIRYVGVRPRQCSRLIFLSESESTHAHVRKHTRLCSDAPSVPPPEHFQHKGFFFRPESLKAQWPDLSWLRERCSQSPWRQLGSLSTPDSSV